MPACDWLSLFDAYQLVHIQGNAFIALELHQIGVFLALAALHKREPDGRVRGHVLPELFGIFRINVRPVIGNEIQFDVLFFFAIKFNKSILFCAFFSMFSIYFLI